MKKKRLLSSIIIIAYTLLVCVSVSFAWILTIKPNVVEDVNIDYADRGNLIIAPNSVDGKIFVTNDQGQEVELTEDFEFPSDQVVPNGIISFKMRLRNNTELPVKVDVILVGIETDNENLLDVTFLSITASTGWTTADMPASKYVLLGDAVKSEVSNTYNMQIYSNVSLRPAEDENDYLDFACYFYFDGENMDNVYQGLSLSIGAFRIMQK